MTTKGSSSESSASELERFRDLVRDDLDLQRLFLQHAGNREIFIRTVVTSGQDRGYEFTAADVENALLIAHKAWIERWID